ncbi:MAG: hypothetical protein ACD_43C00068G0002 [uncultured bacterium]|nr:MAG: hypothetical protein ACD_43C00068G0002 [uncultured bacterium]
MNKRILITIVVAAGVLLLGALIILIIVLRRQPVVDSTSTNTNINTTTTQTNTAVTTNTNAVVTNDATTNTIVPALDDESALRRVINNFSERFGSYSTDTNYENIELTRSLMTETMSKTADSIINKDEQKQTEFYSIESKVMNTTLTDYTPDATGATAEVSVRQTIIAGQANPSYQNKTARLTLVKVKDTWKVDSFRWL